MEQGLIHIYCGDGKGKTTCAFGLALRCAGNGYKVRIVQFLKGGATGELSAVQNIPNIEVLRAKQGTKFTFQMNETERIQAQKEHHMLLKQAFEKTENLRMLVLDEIMAACSAGIADETQLIFFLQNKPDGLEVVMTGRNPSNELVKLADYITEMKKIRHPYDRGIAARLGIER